jgi:hypothetical protein
VHKLSSSGALPARDSLQQGLELLRYDITAHILGHDTAAWLCACPKNDGVDLRQPVGLRNRAAALTMHSDEVRVASNQTISQSNSYAPITTPVFLVESGISVALAGRYERNGLALLSASNHSLHFFNFE